MHKDFPAAVFTQSTDQVWPALLDWSWVCFSAPIDLTSTTLDSVLGQRERDIAPLDNLLAGGAWELWELFEANAPRTSQALIDFWTENLTGKAILILDALSLREAPWLLEQAQQRGYTIHEARATASELPAETTPFAKALGFPQRSALAHNAGKSPYFQNALTETSSLPFADCNALVTPQPGVIFWHQWPDDRMHKLAEEKGGFRLLAKECAEQFRSEDFWSFIACLTTGRRLVITSDHGYANTSLFPDVGTTGQGKAQSQALKTVFKSRRSAQTDAETAAGLLSWTPPLAQRMTTAHGDWHLVLGRKKWRSQGGYPTLAHGGLTLLEVAVPWIEISNPFTA